MSVCNSCPRKCSVDRNVKHGVCGVGKEIKVARAGLHFGEEPCISGTNGSGTIFFSGCSLKCVMCQNYCISHESFGKVISKERLVDIMKSLENKGAHNINFVTPSHYFNEIVDALEIYRPKIPLVYNSSGYDLTQNVQKDIFDIYLFDLKYYSTEKSLKYSKCENYFEVASSAISHAVRIKGEPQFDDRGLLKRGVIVRHLILPGSTNDSINLIKWLNDNTSGIIFSLMSQYVPMYKSCDFPEINRKITKREYNKVLNACYETNFCETYIQDLKSATTDMIPDFDLSGI